MRGRHGTRGWPAHGVRMAGGGGDVRRATIRARLAEVEQGGDGEDDRWARTRKRNKSNLKFETKVFLGLKIHEFFTGDR